MALHAALDYSLTFLFISSKTNARLMMKIDNASRPAKIIYEKQIRRYLFGIGFIFSFIPGTEAFRARMELLETLMGYLYTHPGEFFMPIGNAIEMSILDFSFKKSVDYAISGKTESRLHPFNLFQYVLIAQVSLVAYVCDINNHIPFWIIAMTSFLNSLLLVAIGTMMLIVEFALRIADSIIFEPIRFFIEELKEKFDNDGKTFIYLPEEELNVAVALDLAIHKSPNKAQALEHYSSRNFKLILANAEESIRISRCKASLFSQKYSCHALIGRSDSWIATTWTLLQNLMQFFIYAKSECIPGDIFEVIEKICEQVVNQGEVDQQDAAKRLSEPAFFQ